MRRQIWMILVASLAVVPGAANAQQVLMSEKNLSFTGAHDAAMAALEQCRKGGYHVTVTVLDHTAQPKIVMHDDGANPHTIENSLRKAYTSFTFRTPSGEFGKRVASTPTLVGVLQLDKVTTLEGALPIMSGKDIVGSIGVSGAPGGDKDAVCAQAGIDRIAPGLASQ